MTESYISTGKRCGNEWFRCVRTEDLNLSEAANSRGLSRNTRFCRKMLLLMCPAGYYHVDRKSDEEDSAVGTRKTRYARVSTSFLYGIEGFLADIEVSISPGLPAFEIVGLCDPSIRESKERIRAAIRHAGYEFPTGRITAGLSPAYIHKSGSSIDLPLALCVLLASSQIRPSVRGRIFACGELTLTGQVREVPGSILRLACTRDSGASMVIVPGGSSREAALLDMPVLGVYTLEGAVRCVEGMSSGEILTQEKDFSLARKPDAQAVQNSDFPDDVDYSQLRGQEKTGRAILLAAAGFHNILMTGSPGSGKTTAARILQGIMPPLTPAEKLDILKLRSVSRILADEDLRMVRRPFRYVHHTCTPAAMAGGGINPLPGELSQSLHGVLFLDEMAEFSPRVLDLLRQPLEEDSILISRAGMKIRFPTQFLLVGATNPCRCGKFLESSCTCTELQRKQYLNRISGPLLDRIDLFTELYRVEKDALRESVQGKNLHLSDILRDQVEACWGRQYRRCDEAGVPRVLNGANRTLQITEFFRVTKEAADHAVLSSDRLHISARGLNRLLRVARTAADLEGATDVLPSHVSEALMFRHKTI